ncbi:MAG: heparan-alpha-glucosaminide N-acetyltransferase [Paracoccaceae bacterium]
MEPSLARPRIPALDIARTVALIGMAVYHFNYDREMFGWSAPGTMISPLWFWWARIVAGTFLFLAGVSLWLAHGAGIRWPAFWRRFLRVTGAAVLVSAGTYVAFYNPAPEAGPNPFVFWGILHAIAAYSLIGLAFLRLSWPVIAAVAVGIYAVAVYGHTDLFNAPWFLWLGLASEGPLTVDYEPLFPWLAPFLLGMAFAKAGGLRPFAMLAQGRVGHLLGWPGRHSLAIYLIHQPLLIGGFILAARLGF